MDESGISDLFPHIPHQPPNPASSSLSPLGWQAHSRHVTTPLRLFLDLLSDCRIKQPPSPLNGFYYHPHRDPKPLALVSFSPFPLRVLCDRSVLKPFLSLLSLSSPPQIPTHCLLHAQASLTLHHQILCPPYLNSLGPESISSGAYGLYPGYLFMIDHFVIELLY